jgi:hypothetical protein
VDLKAVKSQRDPTPFTESGRKVIK